MNQITYDVVIIGAGLSGLLSAYALSKSGINVALIDKTDFLNTKHQYFDLRTTAISEGSKIFLDKIEIWEKIQQYSQPIQKIKVFDRGKADKIEFKNPDKKLFLGYVVENKYLRRILINNLLQSNKVNLMHRSELKEIILLNDLVISKTKNYSINSKLCDLEPFVFLYFLYA